MHITPMSEYPQPLKSRPRYRYYQSRFYSLATNILLQIGIRLVKRFGYSPNFDVHYWMDRVSVPNMDSARCRAIMAFNDPTKCKIAQGQIERMEYEWGADYDNRTDRRQAALNKTKQGCS